MVGGSRASWNVRDTHMMDTLDRLMAHHGPQSRAVVWEHSTHVGDARFTDMSAGGLVNVGQLARERYGESDVVLVGAGSHRGTVVAADAWGAQTKVMPLPPARAGSLEELLHRAVGGDALFVHPPAASQPDWLADDLDHRAVGVVYHPERERYGNYVPTVLDRRYDAFLWVDETHALHALHAEPDSPNELETFPAGT